MMIPGDADLVSAVRHGDRDAFGILVERHRARAVGLAAAMLGDLADAEDVGQEALYQAYFGIDRLRDPARFGEWLCGIAINLAKMALRRRRMTFSLEDLDGGRVAHGFRSEDITEVLTLHLTEFQPVRPLTHDFIARLLDTVGVKIDRVAVSAIRDETYFATVTVRSGQQTHEVDARPSDAINLAVRAGVPMFVEAEVMRGQGIRAAEAPRELTETAIRHGDAPEEGYSWRSGREIALAQKGT